MSFLNAVWNDVLAEKQELEKELIYLREIVDKDFESMLANPGLTRALFDALRRHDPVCVLPGVAIVSRYDDVIDVLKRDDIFSVTEIYAAKMEQTTGDFVLGMANTPQFQHELGLMQQVVKPEDLDHIRGLVREWAETLVAAGRIDGKLDVVGGLTRVVPAQLVETYFGTPGPDRDTLMRWMRAIFRHIFLNLENDPGMRDEALSAARALNSHLDAMILIRKGQIAENPDAFDDFLSRLIKLQQTDPAGVPDDTIRRILGGTIVGTVDTNSKAVAQAIDQLLDRPSDLEAAHQAAVAGDPSFDAYVWEALRFNPQNPFLLRHCETDYIVAPGTPRSRTIKAGSLVLVGTTSAMFDELHVADPDAFQTDRREGDYIHFGFGLHECFGRQIGGVLIPETARALLKENGLRRSAENAGRIKYDGAFPDVFDVEFDHD